MLKYGPYSPSRLDSGICGYSFYKTYVDPNREGRGRGLSVAADRGSAIHEVFEMITQRMVGGIAKGEAVNFDDAEIQQWCIEAINRNPASAMAVEEVLEMSRKYVHTPPYYLTGDAETEVNLAVKFDGYDDDGNPSFSECGYEDPQAFGRGKADIFMISDDTTEAHIIDHKTQPHIETADTFQMGFYAWVISKIHPYLERISTTLHFARYGKYSKPFVWTREMLLQHEDAIMTRVGAIEQRESWDAVPNKLCQYCGHIGECPAMRKHVDRLEDGRIVAKPYNFRILGDANKAVEIAGTIHVMEEALKVAKKSLKEHVKNTSPVAIPGVTYMFKESNGVDWKQLNAEPIKGKVDELFEKHGLKPAVIKVYTNEQLKNLWKTHGNLWEELTSLMPRKPATKFEGVKV
jgi:hypothetical protein